MNKSEIGLALSFTTLLIPVLTVLKLTSEYQNEDFLVIGNSTLNFTGSYNGNNFKLLNFIYETINEDYIGLFGYISGESKLLNITIENLTVVGRSYIGGLVGFAGLGTTIEHCKIINGTLDSILNSGDAFIGGLAGYSEANIIKSMAETVLTSNGNFVGGLVGFASSITISNSYAISDILGGDFTGGLIGELAGETSFVENSYAAGILNGKRYVGGFIGFNEGDILNSFSAVDVTGNTSYNSSVGFMMGVNTGISDAVYYDSSRVLENLSEGSFTDHNIWSIPVDVDGYYQGYFYDKTKNPHRYWNYNSTWQDHATRYPSLR